MLLAGAPLLSLVAPSGLPRRRLGNGAIAVALGAALVFAANATVTKQLTWTPGGFALSFGRMLQDGIVQTYLDEHCPRARLVLCAYKDELPRDADEWFWGSPLFDELGRFTGLDAEMERIALASLAEYPLLQIKTAAIATAVNSIWHTYGIVERYRSGLVPDMRAARQQRGPRTLSFGACLPAAAANRRLHAQAERCERDRRARRGLSPCAAGECLRLRHAMRTRMTVTARG